MTQLPPAHTPLNQHSLMALESWLYELGAQRNGENINRWTWDFSDWSAEIHMEQDELRVAWEKDGALSQCSFPYGLSRGDVEAAMSAGP